MESSSLVEMDDLLRALTLSSSSDVNDIKNGEHMLTLMSNKPGYYISLVNVVISDTNSSLKTSSTHLAASGDHDIDATLFNMRWLASLALKNGVEKFWRRNFCGHEDNGESESLHIQEQVEIKKALLNERILKEKDSRINLIMAVTISKIARFDCPDKWGELLPTLLYNIDVSLKEDSEESSNNGLLFLYHVTKVLSQKRLPSDRNAFRNLATEAFPIFKQLCQVNYNKFTLFYHKDQSAAAAVTENAVTAKLTTENLLLTLKTLNKLLINGFSKTREVPIVSEFMEQAFSQYFPTTIQISLTHQSTNKVPTCLCKLFYEFVYNDPLSFAPYVAKCLKELVHVLFIDTKNVSLLSDKFVLKAVILMKTILLCEEFLPNFGLDHSLAHLEHPLTISARQQIDQILTNDVLCVCVEKCVEHYLVLSPKQLQSWNEDGESFFIECETGGDSWQTNNVAAIASLFATLVKLNSPLTSQVILNLYTTVIAPNSTAGATAAALVLLPQDSNTILAYDAVLYAMGLAFYDISAQGPVDGSLFDVLESLIYSQSANGSSFGSSSEQLIDEMKVVRRRVFWFLCYWIDVGLPATGADGGVEERLMERLVNLILFEFSHEKDAVVLLTLVTKTVHSLVDTIDIPHDIVVKHTPTFINHLHSLIQTLELDDSKSKVLATLSLTLDRTRFDIVLPFMNDISILLQNLWQQSSRDSQQYLRSSVIECLVFVVSGLRTNCYMVFNLTKEIVLHSLDSQNDQSINLMSNGLELLLTFVQNTEENSHNQEELLNLFPIILPCLELGQEYPFMALDAISSYCMLFNTKLYLLFGNQINAALLSLYRDCSKDLMNILVQTIKVYFQVSLTGSYEEVASCESIVELLNTLLQEVLDQDGSSLMQSDLIAIFSRLVIEKLPIFVATISLFARLSQLSPEAVLSRLIGIVCDCIDDIVDVRTRKLTALALIYLLNPENSSADLIQERFAEVIYATLSCLHDLVDTVTQTDDMLLVREPKLLLQGVDEPISDSIETAHDVREKLLNQSCVTSTHSLKDELRNLLNVLSNHPNIKFDQMMNSIAETCKLELENFFR